MLCVDANVKKCLPIRSLFLSFRSEKACACILRGMARVLAALFSTISSRAKTGAAALENSDPPTHASERSISLTRTAHALVPIQPVMLSPRFGTTLLQISVYLPRSVSLWRVSRFNILNRPKPSLVCRSKCVQFSESCRRVMFCLWTVQWKFSRLISSIYLIVRQPLPESCEDGRNWKCRWHKTIK